MSDASPTGPILIVEDEAMLAFDLEDILHEAGYADVVVCNTFDKAAAALDARRFPLAVFDLNLDGRLSLPLVERAREAGTRVVVASGYDADAVPLADTTIPRISKPYDPQELMRALGLLASRAA